MGASGIHREAEPLLQEGLRTTASTPAQGSGAALGSSPSTSYQLGQGQSQHQLSPGEVARPGPSSPVTSTRREMCGFQLKAEHLDETQGLSLEMTWLTAQ